MSPTPFFLASSWPQSIALDRIARWEHFTSPSEAGWMLRSAAEAESKKRRPRRKVLAALSAAHAAAAGGTEERRAA